MSFLSASLRSLPKLLNFASSSNGQQVRHATKFAPTYVRHARVHKGRAPVPIGGSIKGTTLAFGEYGIRVKGEGLRISAKQLMAAEAALKRKLKPCKGAKLWMRVFPDFPVCVKGNETRMGKGKGSFEYWACWIPTGRVLFEIAGDPNSGVELRPELARDALRLAADKLPVTVDYIDRSTPHRLGNLDIVRPPGGKHASGLTEQTGVDGKRYLVGGVRGLRVLGVERPQVSNVPS